MDPRAGAGRPPLHREAIRDHVDEQTRQSNDIIMPDDLPDDWDPPF